MPTLEEMKAQLMRRAARAAEAELFPTLTRRRQNGGAMPDLTDEIKEFIVKALACYDTPSYVADAVNVNFGVTVSRQQVYRYDPECSQPPAQRWRDLHAATRAAFLRDAAAIGITHKLVRLRRLDRLASRCERNSVALAIACIERAAKECGGLYENRRQLMVQITVPPQPAPQPALPEVPIAEPRPEAVITSIRFPQLPNLSGAVDAQPLNANRQ
jgi:hypothetical protein